MPRSRFSDLLPSMLLLLHPQGHPGADPPLGAGRQLPGTSWPTLGRYRALLLALIVVLWSFAQRACPTKKMSTGFRTSWCVPRWCGALASPSSGWKKRGQHDHRLIAFESSPFTSCVYRDQVIKLWRYRSRQGRGRKKEKR